MARAALAYSCSRQLPDGAWYYGEESRYHWIDNFHTGYNLDSIQCYIDNTGDQTFSHTWIAGSGTSSRPSSSPTGGPSTITTGHIRLISSAPLRRSRPWRTSPPTIRGALRDRREGRTVDHPQPAGSERLLLLPPVSPRGREDPHAPLGAGHDVPGAGVAVVEARARTAGSDCRRGRAPVWRAPMTNTLAFCSISALDRPLAEVAALTAARRPRRARGDGASTAPRSGGGARCRPRGGRAVRAAGIDGGCLRLVPRALRPDRAGPTRERAAAHRRRARHAAPARLGRADSRRVERHRPGGRTSARRLRRRRGRRHHGRDRAPPRLVRRHARAHRAACSTPSTGQTSRSTTRCSTSCPRRMSPPSPTMRRASSPSRATSI